LCFDARAAQDSRSLALHATDATIVENDAGANVAYERFLKSSKCTVVYRVH